MKDLPITHGEHVMRCPTLRMRSISSANSTSRCAISAPTRAGLRCCVAKCGRFVLDVSCVKPNLVAHVPATRVKCSNRKDICGAQAIAPSHAAAMHRTIKFSRSWRDDVTRGETVESQTSFRSYSSRTPLAGKHPLCATAIPARGRFVFALQRAAQHLLGFD